jgi:phosphohistidine phosphatase SixA
MHTRSGRLVTTLLLALLLPLAPVAAPAQERAPSATVPASRTTTVILVRHAEKAVVPGDDPPLSPEGEARALALRDALRDAGVAVALVTRFRRTGDTALPLVQSAGVPMEKVEIDANVERHARRVADAVSRHAGRTVLVVGHSNTLPAIIAALGGGVVRPIRDHEYDDLFVLQKPAEGPARLIRAHYGAPNPERAP